MGSADRPGPGGMDLPPTWQPLPGLTTARYLFLESRGDPCSSNTTLVHLPGALVIVDPGSAPAQAAAISNAAADVPGIADIPVLIVLTHAHWDHFAGLPLLSLPAGRPVAVLAHHAMNAALAGDARLTTQAFMFNAECPAVRVDVPLLAPPRDGTTAPSPNVGPAPGLGIELMAGELRLGSGRQVPAEMIRVGGAEVARVFGTPGHSPDSLCILIGGMLWVGDLLLAANPAVAGIRGWDGRALLASLDAVDDMLATLPLELCCPGHGRLLAPPKARQILAGTRAQAAELGDVATLDPARVHMLVECAGELLREGVALFTVIAGRLYTVSYHLDALEESQTAKEVLQAMDIGGLDAALDELGSFAAQFHARHRLEVALPLKGIQTVRRIEELFDTARLRGLIDPVLLRRARRLLDDFVHIVRGIEPPSLVSPHDVRTLLSGLADSFRPRPPEPAHDLWDASADEQAFRQALTRRLAAEASAVRVDVDLSIPLSMPPVAIDGERIGDVLHGILGAFAGAGVDRVGIGATPSPDGDCRLVIRPVPDRRVGCFDAGVQRFLDRSLRAGGGRLTDASTDASTVLDVDLDAAAPA